MAKINIAGGIVGGVHVRGASLLTDGRSLHPLQRMGGVSHSGFPSVGTGDVAHFGTALPVGATDLSYPAQLTPGIALHPALRV